MDYQRIIEIDYRKKKKKIFKKKKKKSQNFGTDFHFFPILIQTIQPNKKKKR